jgi:hypothetical protein
MRTFIHITMGKPGDIPTAEDMQAVHHLYAEDYLQYKVSEMGAISGGRIHMEKISVPNQALVSIFNPMPPALWPLDPEQLDKVKIVVNHVLAVLDQDRADGMLRSRPPCIITHANIGIRVVSLEDQTVIHRSE